MNSSTAESLISLISELASGAVEIQRTFNQRFETEEKKYEFLLASTPPQLRQYLAPLAPRRQQLLSHEVQARIKLYKEITREGKVRLGTILLNLSADLRYQRNTESDYQIKIHVQQIMVHAKEE